MNTGLIWLIVFILVAAALFFFIWYATRLKTTALGTITREEFNSLINRVNILWAILLFWIIVNLLFLLVGLFVPGHEFLKVSMSK
jgi:hypothetical protein